MSSRVLIKYPATSHELGCDCYLEIPDEPQLVRIISDPRFRNLAMASEHGWYLRLEPDAEPLVPVYHLPGPVTAYAKQIGIEGKYNIYASCSEVELQAIREIYDQVKIINQTHDFLGVSCVLQVRTCKSVQQLWIRIGWMDEDTRGSTAYPLPSRLECAKRSLDRFRD
jgi:hypothetical protein